MPALEPAAENALRQILARWAYCMPGNPLADFAEKMTLIAAREKPAYLVELRTLYDLRGAIKEQKVPFRDGDKIAAGSKDVWTHAVSLPADYTDQETDVVSATSGEADPCPACNGDGRKICKTCIGGKTMPCPDCTGKDAKKCPQCAGLGKVACVQCAGKGQVLVAVSGATRQEAACPACAGTGGPKCDKCDNGLIDCKRCANSRVVACSACEGKGGTTCAVCQGARQVINGFTFHVAYRPVFQRKLSADAETPDGLLPVDPGWKKLGDVVYEREGASLGALEPAPPEPTRALVADLLAKAQASAGNMDQPARIIKQKVVVERVPVYEGVYEYGGKKYSCWATALEGKVVSARDPFTELAATLIEKAEERLGEGDGAEAAKLLAQAGPMRRDGWAKSVEKRLGSGAAAEGPDASAALAAAVILAPTLLLALLHRGSPHLFWPLAAYAALACGVGWAVGRYANAWLSERLTPRGISLACPAAGSAVALVLFLIVGPVKRLDAAEFLARLNGHLPVPGMPLPAEDRGYLKLLIAEFAPLGVDVSAAQEALDAEAKRLAEAAAAEQARLDAARQEKLIAAAAAKRRAQELAAKKKAAAAAAKKKKKKKKRR